MKTNTAIHILLLSLPISLFAQFSSLPNGQFAISQPFISSTAVNVNLDSLTLDSLLLRYKDSQSIPGIATLILKNDNVIWNKNYGYADIATQRPVTDTTAFYLASVSKTFVAIAVMQLWEHGLIDLDRNISCYLPNGMTIVNPYFASDSITAKMILTHSSSIQDIWPFLEAVRVCGDSPIRLDTFLMQYFTPGRIYYSSYNFYNIKPGTQYHYSNVAVCLLALAVETITGRSFEEYCADSIFTPLDMNTTSWHLAGMDLSNIATPYSASWSCHEGKPWYPAGDVRTNKLELSHFLLACMNHGTYQDFRLLDSATVEYMLSDHLGHLADGTFTQGLIWLLYPRGPEGLWGHNGASYGAETYAGFSPTEMSVVIILQNSCEPSAPYVQMEGVVDILHSFARQYGKIYAVRPSVDKPYARMGTDSVLFRTTFSNAQNHKFSARIVYSNTNKTEVDSVDLRDDGQHGDILAGDGMYGCSIGPRWYEDFFAIGISTIDSVTNEYYHTPDIWGFTSGGPLALDSIMNVPQSYGKYCGFMPFVRNDGCTWTVTGASVSLSCTDPWVTTITPASLSLDSIPPGSNAYPTGGYNFSVGYNTSEVPDTFNLKFDIAIHGIVCWTDSVRAVVTGVAKHRQLPTAFALHQNYPNPFNPSTRIEFSIATLSMVNLKIYNLLGQEVATLVNETKRAGSYSLNWDASSLPSGVYIYRLKTHQTMGGQAGSFADTKKLILLK